MLLPKLGLSRHLCSGCPVFSLCATIQVYIEVDLSEVDFSEGSEKMAVNYSLGGRKMKIFGISVITANYAVSLPHMMKLSILWTLFHS